MVSNRLIKMFLHRELDLVDFWQTRESNLMFFIFLFLFLWWLFRYISWYATWHADNFRHIHIRKCIEICLSKGMTLKILEFHHIKWGWHSNPSIFVSSAFPSIIGRTSLLVRSKQIIIPQVSLNVGKLNIEHDNASLHSAWIHIHMANRNIQLP